jgi:hypothetical protein
MRPGLPFTTCWLAIVEHGELGCRLKSVLRQKGVPAQRIMLLHPLPGTPNVLSFAAARPGGYDVILLPGYRTLAIGQYFWTLPDSSRHYMAKLMQALYDRLG